MADPILTEDLSRFTAFPIVYDDIWSLYKKQSGCFWRAEEIDLSKILHTGNSSQMMSGFLSNIYLPSSLR
jgi:hypothetical protein